MKKNLTILVLSLAVLGFSGCDSKEEKELKEANKQVEDEFKNDKNKEQHYEKVMDSTRDFSPFPFPKK
ncbi:MAG: hypothetical protein LBG67_00915 [Campylobacteraceae bacterium]|jgi:sulfur transfer protein SufE|nr:hypothetical protein [Campylobacteraceae bacterium]